MTTYSMRAILIFGLSALLSLCANAQKKNELKGRSLVKFKSDLSASASYAWMSQKPGWTVTPLSVHASERWVLVKGPSTEVLQTRLNNLSTSSDIEYIQPDYPVHLLNDYRMQDPLRRRAIERSAKALQIYAKPMPPDNPALPTDLIAGQGMDPDLKKQWGMLDIQSAEAWKIHSDSRKIIVAVIDSGIDYTHEDLRPNLWINGKEIAGNGIDDDKNGYVDDVLGWDFVSNDNKPFDLAVDAMKLISKGGNPGHGTHCAGNVGARGGNGIGISGVAPNVQIMGLRFISEVGSGMTSGAISAIRYAVDNGAKVLSNSWGSEGEDPSAGEENQALRDAIAYAESHGVLFVAAAGNGHKMRAYDNDNDPNPAYPSSYPHDNIISVTAVDVNNNLGGFANWGLKSVDIAAPGLNVYSTTVGGSYSDKVIDLASIAVDWDGTSMATPHVAGAAALYWGANPTKSWQEVKDAVLNSGTPLPNLKGKILTGSKLNVLEMMKH